MGKRGDQRIPKRICETEISLKIITFELWIYRRNLRTIQSEKKLLQQIIDAYDNAVVSHKLDKNQNVIAIYDKYSNI